MDKLSGVRHLCLILLNDSVFVKLPSGCYFQLTGKPFHEVGVRNDTKKQNRVPFDRWRMFYCNSYHAKAGFPSKHILASLAKLNDDETAAKKLLCHVFKRISPHRLRPRLTQAIPIFEDILKRYRRFCFGRVLTSCCPIFPRYPSNPRVTMNAESQLMSWHSRDDGYHTQPESDSDEESSCSTTAEQLQSHSFRRKGRLNGIPLPTLLTMSSSHKEVGSFIRRVCVGIFPRKLWGSEHNESIFLKKINLFLRLRRHEGMCISEFTHGMRTNDCCWLQLPQRMKQNDHEAPKRFVS
jgi:hypothetical protein